MTSCIRCGGPLGDFDAGGDMICQNCESRAQPGAGGHGGTNVPCQRCGMYLPSHELRMHNSRLYCAYCIMDIQDEEKYLRAGGREGAGAGHGGHTGFCERCGRETGTLYTANGRRLCQSCYTAGSPGGAGAGGAPVLALIFEKVAVALGVRQKPSAAPELPPGKIASRAISPEEDRERQRKSLERFNLKERRMMMEEEGQLGIEPLSEGRKADRKPSPVARKKFFFQHSEKKK